MSSAHVGSSIRRSTVQRILASRRQHSPPIMLVSVGCISRFRGWYLCRLEVDCSATVTRSHEAIVGGEGVRTPDLMLAKPALCQTELRPLSKLQGWLRVRDLTP